MILDLSKNPISILKDSLASGYSSGINNGLIALADEIWGGNLAGYCLFITNGKALVSIPVELELDSPVEEAFFREEWDGGVKYRKIINGNFLSHILSKANNGKAFIKFTKNEYGEFVEVTIKSKRKTVTELQPADNLKCNGMYFPNLKAVCDSAFFNRKHSSSRLDNIAFNPEFLGGISESFGNPISLKLEFTGATGPIIVTPRNIGEEGNSPIDPRLKALLMPMVV